MNKSASSLLIVGAVFSVLCSNVDAQNAYSTVSAFAGRTHRGRFVIREYPHKTFVRGRWGGGIQPWVAEGFTTLGTTFLNNNVLFPTGVFQAPAAFVGLPQGNNDGTAQTTGDKTVLAESAKRRDSKFDDQHADRNERLSENERRLERLNKALGVQSEFDGLRIEPESKLKDGERTPLGGEPTPLS